MSGSELWEVRESFSVLVYLSLQIINGEHLPEYVNSFETEALNQAVRGALTSVLPRGANGEENQVHRGLAPAELAENATKVSGRRRAGNEGKLHWGMRFFGCPMRQSG